MHLFHSKTEENLPACMLSCRGMIGLIIIDGCLSKSFLVKIFINAIGTNTVMFTSNIGTVTVCSNQCYRYGVYLINQSVRAQMC